MNMLILNTLFHQKVFWECQDEESKQLPMKMLILYTLSPKGCSGVPRWRIKTVAYEYAYIIYSFTKRAKSISHIDSNAKAVEGLLRSRAFVVKRTVGPECRKGQVTWSKFGTVREAWVEACARSGFWKMSASFHHTQFCPWKGLRSLGFIKHAS